MIADFETLCAWMYVLVSDLDAQTPPDPSAPMRPGPAAAVCSDAELLTMALVGECYGWDGETELREALAGASRSVSPPAGAHAVHASLQPPSAGVGCATQPAAARIAGHAGRCLRSAVCDR